jgi:hypothetical protein
MIDQDAGCTDTRLLLGCTIHHIDVYRVNSTVQTAGDWEQCKEYARNYIIANSIPDYKTLIQSHWVHPCCQLAFPPLEFAMNWVQT